MQDVQTTNDWTQIRQKVAHKKWNIMFYTDKLLRQSWYWKLLAPIIEAKSGQ